MREVKGLVCTWLYLVTPSLHLVCTWLHLVIPGYTKFAPGLHLVTPGLHLVTPGYTWLTPGLQLICTWLHLVTPSLQLITPGYRKRHRGERCSIVGKSESGSKYPQGGCGFEKKSEK